MKTLPDGTKKRVLLDAGENPRDGLTVWYYLREDAKPDAFEVCFLDGAGTEIRSFSPKPAPPGKAEDRDDFPPESVGASAPGRVVVVQGGIQVGGNIVPSAGKRLLWGRKRNARMPAWSITARSQVCIRPGEESSLPVKTVASGQDAWNCICHIDFAPAPKNDALSVFDSTRY